MSKSENLIILDKHGINIPKLFVVNEKDCLKNKIDIFLKLYNCNSKFAIRSAADIEDGKKYSFAGMLTTYLNIPKDNVEKYINMCIKSKDDINVKKYCESFDLDSNFSMSVIIQEMIDSDVSGVVFTANPINQKREYIVECVYGQGEGIVSGLIKPDRIICSLNKEIISYKVSHQAYQLKANNKKSLLVKTPVEYLYQSRKKINRNQIIALLKEVDKIKAILNTEIDVEWCIKDEVIYILQARPITTI